VPRTTTRQLLQALQALVTAAVVVIGCYLLARSWGDVMQSLRQLSPLYWMPALASALAAMGCATKSWQVLFDGLGSPLGVRRASPIFLVGQLGKYVPGSVWTYVLQADLGRRVGVPRARVLKATLAASLIAVVAALMTSVLAVPGIINQSPDLRMLLWLYALLPVCAVALHPRVLRAIVGLAMSVLRKPNPLPLLRMRTVMFAFAWAALSYALFGTHLWLLVLSNPGTGVVDLGQCTGTIALAMIAGVLVLILPSGLGVRELVIYAGLLPIVGSASALAMAAVSRAVLTVGDLAVATTSAAWGWRIVRKGSMSPVEVSTQASPAGADPELR
jgi:glycosyltransferase 2 family protein